jgi:hypothetical protein
MRAESTRDVEVDKLAITFVGKLVRYKRHLLTAEFLIIEGEWAKDCLFHVKEISIENGEVTLKSKIDRCPLTFRIDPNNVELVAQ